MNTTDPLQLECGNPEIIDNPASFSRFVFPFAYRLEKLEKQPQGLFYQQNDGSTHQYRKKYLTNETALVLFERAKWFEIAEETWKETPWEKETITVNLKKGDFEIKMLPPALILFEFPEYQEKSKSSVLQTGLLYVDIYFPKKDLIPTLDDLLLFNELFRYFDMPHEGHVKDYKKCLKNVPIDYPIDNSRYRKLNDTNTDDRARYFVRWLKLLKITINYDGQNYTLIPDTWVNSAKEWIYRSEIQKSIDDENRLVHVDNRCYVWTAAFISKGGNALNKAFNVWPSSKLRAHHFGHWVKLLNIDAPNETAQETHKAISDFEKKWAKARTYKRWQQQGTWYGYNYHSGVILADPIPSDLKYLCRVFREQYFDQTILLLYLRTTLFHFSRKLSLIIHTQKQQTNDHNEWLKQIRQVRREFSRFAILYQFPSLSNQQQAIEMYTLARECLDIDDLYREVQEEIANTHDFLEQAETNKLSNAANLLARWGVPIAATSVVASLFGMNEYNFLINCTENCVWNAIGIPIIFALLAGAIVWLITKKLITKGRDQ